MAEERPDPNELLARLRAEERRAVHGRLEVFLGMCPGVGKTYAMLESAQEDRHEGKTVLVGVVETHGRPATQELLDGLPILPRRKLEHRGISLEEFDLDAARRARPPLIIVDELAHTNASGSRHSKRWQDVRELIEAGIDVRTTLNIQHVESLNDVVAQITGVRMQETVPDSVLEQADEVVLVDLPPDELLERLQAGKVYLGAQAQRAAEGFFKPANLTALRELALRFLAGRVGKQVRFYREAAGSPAIWPTQERVLVAIGPSPSSATLARSAKRLASMLGAEWFALFVETPHALAAPSRQRVMEHLRLAESLGAKTATVSATTIPEGILRFARRENVTKLVVGKPLKSWWNELLRRSPVDELVRKSGDVDVYVIRGESEPGVPLALQPTTASRERGLWKIYIPIAAATCAVAFGKVLDSFVTLPDVAMIFLFASAAVATLGSRRAAFFMAALCVIAFDFFFVPPLYTLRVAGTDYFITFAMLFVVSLGVSVLSLRMRLGRDLARRSEERTASLYRFSARLAEARGSEAVVAAALPEVSSNLGAPVAITLPSADGQMTTRGEKLDAKESAVVRWVLDNARPAGRDTQTLSSSAMTHLPLLGPRGCVGVLSFGGRALPPEQIELLHAHARHLALVLSIEGLDEDRRRSAREAEIERLRSSILSAVSHDLRTPLASILGSASSLLEQGEGLDATTRHELLATISDEAGRLNRLITNLLEMTKLEGGDVRLHKVAIPIDEIVGAGLHAVRHLLRDREISTDIPKTIPFVEVDELLVQQVLINLLENASKHTPPGTPIDVGAVTEGKFVRITVADRGPGLPPVDNERLFERFYRGDQTTTGAGLGLAICKGIVVAHGGEIGARGREGGGAEFHFTLPIAREMPPPEEEMQDRST